MTPLLRPGSATPQELLDILNNDHDLDIFSPEERHTGAEQLYFRPAVITESVPERAIWGFRYIPILERLVSRGVNESIPVVRAVSNPEDGNRFLRIALEVEQRSGAYRWDEIDRVFSYAEGVTRSGVPQEIRDLVDPDRDVTDLLRRYRKLPAVLKEALLGERIDIRTAEMVPPSMADNIKPLLSAFDQLSFSDRRQALRISSDLVRHGDMSVDRVMAIVRKEDPRGILEMLRRYRYPRMTEMEGALRRFRDIYTRGKGIEVAFPPNYEGDYMQISFKIRSGVEMRRRIASLHAMEEEVNGLLGLLFPDN